MSDSARQHTAPSELEKLLREKLGLLAFALQVFPQSENRETARVAINAKGCADTEMAVIAGRSRSYRQVYERVYGIALVEGPM